MIIGIFLLARRYILTPDTLRLIRLAKRARIIHASKNLSARYEGKAFARHFIFNSADLKRKGGRKRMSAAYYDADLVALPRHSLHLTGHFPASLFSAHRCLSITKLPFCCRALRFASGVVNVKRCTK